MTLQLQGYVCDIVMLLCFLDCDHVMLVKLQHYCVPHVATFVFSHEMATSSYFFHMTMFLYV
jgi:hypothetical protein